MSKKNREKDSRREEKHVTVLLLTSKIPFAVQHNVLGF
jgi:hypothetical protein